MIASELWLSVFWEEYLDTFVRDGGATVKFVTGEESQLEALRSHLKGRAASGGFLYVEVSGLETKIHMIEHVFHAVATQLNWRGLARTVSEQAVRESGYPIPSSGDLTFSAIAAETGSTTFLVRDTLHKWLTRQLFRDYQMTQEFRLAMMRLALEPMEHPDPGTGGLTDNIIEWLRGDLRLVSALKPALIFQKVARHNARDTFVSLTHWVRAAGYPGLVVVLDVGAYTVANRRLAVGNYYTRAAAMDLYEVLRQFVDATDELEGCAIVVLAPADWASDESRGLRMYRALAARVSDEVSGKDHDDPLAVLTRLGD